MTTKTKKTTAATEKKPLKKGITITHACATAFCETPPVKGSSYCAEHKPLAAAAEQKLDAMDAANAKRAAKALKDPRVRKQLAALIAGTKTEPMSTACGARGCLKAPVAQTPKGPRCAEHLPQTKSEATPKVPAKEEAAAETVPAAEAMDARPTIAALEAKGWSAASIAQALKTSAGRVYHWRRGANCKRIADLQSLVFQQVPRADLVLPAPKTGSLKAPRAAAQASPKASLASSWDDRRQLALELVSAILADKE